MANRLTHNCSKETDIELLKQDNAHLKSKIDEIHKAIVGNGTPGIKTSIQTLSLIQSQHINTLNKHDEIINNLNLKLAYYAGAVGVIVFIITWLPKWL